MVAEAYVDSKSLVDNIQLSKLLTEKRLRVDLAATRQSVERGVIWVHGHDQIADRLTKAGASSAKLLEALCKGCIWCPQPRII